MAPAIGDARALADFADSCILMHSERRLRWMRGLFSETGHERWGDVIRASVVGATGFTGAVLTGLLARHPEVHIDALTSTSYVGRSVRETFPHLRVDGTYVSFEAARLADSEIVFVCYPHAQAHPVVAQLLEAGCRVIDLSADFRLKDPALYPEWYGFEHPRPDLLALAVYGLPELYRDEIATAKLVANPGCFPTGMLLALLPLAERFLPDLVIDDAKSGVSGAGRTPSAKTHFSSVYDDFRAYAEVGHRHTAEMVQELATIAGSPVPVSFTPHLLPVDRGILSTVYIRPGAESSDEVLDADTLSKLYVRAYAAEPFVEVVEGVPGLHEVQHTNFCRLAVRVDAAAGVVKVVSAIDNLMKGASGQAVQNFNIMFGLPETLGLEVGG
jgi:N-acetyl-gamma-glutamyl-phosphate reductase